MSPVQRRLAVAADEITQIDPWTANTVGFIPRMLAKVQFFPHQKSNADAYRCVNGNVTVSIVDTTSLGLPSGTKPRIITAWLTTKVVQEKKRRIEIDSSLKQFMESMGIKQSSGGDNGSNTHLIREATKLFGCSIGYKHASDEKLSTESLSFSSQQEMWWKPKEPGALLHEGSFVELSKEFYENIRTKPVPIALRAFRALQNSCLSLDLYCWLTYRMLTIHKETPVKISDLLNQFGAGYDVKKRGLGNFQYRLKQ